MWDRAAASTQQKGHDPQIRVNRFSSSDQRRTRPVFRQLMRQLDAPYMVPVLRHAAANHRPWIVVLEGEGGVDQGGPFNEVITQALDDIKTAYTGVPPSMREEEEKGVQAATAELSSTAIAEIFERLQPSQADREESGADVPLPAAVEGVLNSEVNITEGKPSMRFPGSPLIPATPPLSPASASSVMVYTPPTLAPMRLASPFVGARGARLPQRKNNGSFSSSQVLEDIPSLLLPPPMPAASTPPGARTPVLATASAAQAAESMFSPEDHANDELFTPQHRLPYSPTLSVSTSYSDLASVEDLTGDSGSPGPVEENRDSLGAAPSEVAPGAAAAPQAAGEQTLIDTLSHIELGSQRACARHADTIVRHPPVHGSYVAHLSPRRHEWEEKQEIVQERKGSEGASGGQVVQRHAQETPETAAIKGKKDPAAPFTALFMPAPNAIRQEGESLDRIVPYPWHVQDTLPGASKAQGALAPRLPYYRFLGKLLAVCLRLRFHITLSLPRLFWKRLVGQEPNEEDLKEIDDRFVKEITQIRNSPFLLADKATMWTVASSDGQHLPLVPGGQSRRVQPSEADSYVAMCLRYRLHEFDYIWDVIIDGMMCVIPTPVMRLFTWREAEVYGCGEQTIDLELVKRHTSYTGGYGANHPVVQLFWTAMTSMNPMEQAQVLRFITARARMSPEFLSQRGLTISAFPRDNPDGTLPLAHTCMSQIDLPAYTSEASMRRNLLLAATLCVGYDLDGAAQGVEAVDYASD